MTYQKVLSGVVALSCTSLALGNNDNPYADYSNNSATNNEYVTTGYDASANDALYSGYDISSYDYDSNSSDTASGPYASIPKISYFEYLGPMSTRNGNGHATLTNWLTTFNLADVSSKSWRFDMDASFRLSWFDGKNDAAMDIHRLYTIWMNVGAHYNMWGKTFLTIGFNPEFSSDFDSWVARNFNLGGYLTVSSQVNDNFSFSAGMALVPQLGGSFPAIPYLGFRWQASPNWSVEMEGAKLKVIKKVTDYFSWGPFVSLVSGAWVVKHEYNHARYEWRSGIAGITTKTRLGTWGKAHPHLILDAGFSFANSARFRTTNGKHTLSKKHYDPGFYMRAGLNFAF